jgi:hypothetical protein
MYKDIHEVIHGANIVFYCIQQNFRIKNNLV